MFFFCKPKTLVLDAFTAHYHVANLLPPDYASKFKPKWWYDLRSHENITLPSGVSSKGNTMKRCRGFKDYYSNASIIIPLWDSFILEFNYERYMFSFSSKEHTLEYQHEIQRGQHYLNDFHQLKLISPWKFREKTGINFLFTQAFYNFKDPTEFVMPPAIVNYKQQPTTEVNFFVRKPSVGVTGRIELEAGHPLVYLTPLTEKRVVVKTHVVTPEELQKLYRPMIFFSGSYGKLKRLGYGK